MEIQDTKTEINWTGHSGFQIKNSKIIYIDPYQISEKFSNEKADIILITHSHYDHCSHEDLRKIMKKGTKIICPPDCQSKVTRFQEPISIDVIQPNQEIEINQIKISTIPAYNIDKSFHPKEENWIGYIIKLENLIIYHSGDTDKIPEMQKLTGHKQKDKKFVILLPVGGRFTMNPEEAFEVAKEIKPDIAIPMHYGNIIGNHEDAQEFKELCEEKKINVEILEKE